MRGRISSFLLKQFDAAQLPKNKNAPLFLFFNSRSLPKTMSTLSNRVASHAGLELKICMNTYKILFVENTEDFFYRLPTSNSIQAQDGLTSSIQKGLKFKNWLDDERTGWKRNLRSPERALQECLAILEGQSHDVQLEEVVEGGIGSGNFIQGNNVIGGGDDDGDDGGGGGGGDGDSAVPMETD